ncbi:MAG TPA: hypothetical protein VFI06_00320 [Chitinophagaceae bacterium]|nr:hypothetical protein [Chitinophagaceae bacterium]
MKGTGLLFLCFLSGICLGNTFNDSSLLIRPHFKFGETKTYLVTEEMKAGELLPAKSTSLFRVSFSVLDTTGGFTIAYTVKLLKTTNTRLVLSSVVARISDNIQFIYKVGKDGWVTHLVNDFDVQKKLIMSLDSLVKQENYQGNDMILMYHLLKGLIKKDGVAICLAPLMLFNNIFRQAEFRRSKDFTAGHGMSILNERKLPGVLITQLKSIRREENYAKVKLDFKANRDSSAEKFIPAFQEIYISLMGKPFKTADLPKEMRRDDFESEYEIMLEEGWPRKISDRTVQFYLDRFATKMTMILVDE